MLASKGKNNQSKSSFIKLPRLNYSNLQWQTDLLNQLLDILLSQTKGYKLDILKHLRDPTGKGLKGSV